MARLPKVKKKVPLKSASVQKRALLTSLCLCGLFFFCKRSCKYKKRAKRRLGIMKKLNFEKSISKSLEWLTKMGGKTKINNIKENCRKNLKFVI